MECERLRDERRLGVGSAIESSARSAEDPIAPLPRGPFNLEDARIPRLTYTKKLQELLGDKYIDFDSLNYLEKTSYVLGSELWEDDFSSLLSIVKEFIVDVWESRKLRLYGENACPGPQPNSSGWDLGQDGKLWNGRNGRSGKLSHSSDVIGACLCSNDVNVCGSAHCGCVVNGSVAMAAF